MGSGYQDRILLLQVLMGVQRLHRQLLRVLRIIKKSLARRNLEELPLQAFRVCQCLSLPIHIIELSMRCQTAHPLSRARIKIITSRQNPVGTVAVYRHPNQLMTFCLLTTRKLLLRLDPTIRRY